MSGDMQKLPLDYDCQRHGDPPSGFVCPKCGSTMDENPREAAAAQERAGDDMRKALERIAAIENQESGSDWAEIEEAREIANAALQATPSRPVSGDWRELFQHVDDMDWEYLLSRIGDGGRDRFWKTVIADIRTAIAAPPAAAWDAGEHEGCGIDSERAFKEQTAPAAAAPEQDRLRLALNDALNRRDWAATENALQAIRLAADDYPKRREGWVR